MNIYTIKTLSRPVLRRPLHLSKTLNISRRPQHTKPNTKPLDESNGTSIPIPNTVPTVPLWYQRLGPITAAFSAYGRSQRKSPLLTQFISSLVIYACGDLSAQKINGEEYDWKRTVRALFISAGSSIPTYKWFIFLGQSFNYPSHLLSLLTKVTVNQIVFTPIFNTYFFGMQSLLSGDSLAEILDRIERTVPTSFINSCKLWPAVTAFSFTFVGAQYRSIFAGFIAIGWQTYLSYLNRLAEEAAAGEEEEERGQVMGLE